MNPLEPDAAFKAIMDGDLQGDALHEVIEAVWQDGFDAGHQEGSRGDD